VNLQGDHDVTVTTFRSQGSSGDPPGPVQSAIGMFPVTENQIDHGIVGKKTNQTHLGILLASPGLPSRTGHPGAIAPEVPERKPCRRPRFVLGQVLVRLG